jgi:trans-aconitate 2-methyltransferase
MPYSFRDTTLAAGRLALLARVFAPEAAALLAEACHRPPFIAVDLGCGPGHTTLLLADATRAQRVIGVDTSAAFLAPARQRCGRRASFLCHDATTLPFSVPAADLLFCHFLLGHLSEPERVLAGWITQLTRHGRLVIDEVEAIQTDIPVFREYLAVVDALVRHNGGELYVGPRLHGLDAVRGAKRVASRAVVFPVSPIDAAAMFLAQPPGLARRPLRRPRLPRRHARRYRCRPRPRENERLPR